MKRKLVMGLLVLGTVGGFASGFRSMRCHAHERRDNFERHVADVCVRAARDANDSASERGGDGEARKARDR